MGFQREREDVGNVKLKYNSISLVSHDDFGVFV